MRQKSIQKNYIFNLIYQVLLLFTPLITTPYISRVLGVLNIGTASYIESTVSYFTLFAIVGVNIYGQREISYCQDNKEKRSEVFWNIKIFNVFTSVICLIGYIFFSFTQNSYTLYLIYSLNIVSVIFDITWFFQGMEEFGIIVFRNVIIKVLNIIYIFVFIKSPDDLFLYILGNVSFILLSNVIMWTYMPKYVFKPNIKLLHPFKNWKIILSLFIPTISIQIYTVLDKTMIGIITQDFYQNGYYEQAIKISRIVLTVVTSLGTVMIPRIGYHFEKNNIEIIKSYMYRSYRFVWFLAIPLCFGLIGTAQNFIPWFLGNDFLGAIPILCILSMLLIAIGINNVTGMQYLIPTKRQNFFTRTVVIGALVNFSLNIVLIPICQSMGAAIASVAAETTIAIYQFILVRNELSAKVIIKSSVKYLFAGFIMLFVLMIENIWLSPSIINSLVMVTSGGFAYFCILLLMRDEFLLSNLTKMKSIIIKIKHKFL